MLDRLEAKVEKMLKARTLLFFVLENLSPFSGALIMTWYLCNSKVQSALEWDEAAGLGYGDAMDVRPEWTANVPLKWVRGPKSFLRMFCVSTRSTKSGSLFFAWAKEDFTHNLFPLLRQKKEKTVALMIHLWSWMYTYCTDSCLPTLRKSRLT